MVVLLIRAHALMKPNRDWSRTPDCLADRRFCASPYHYSPAMEQRCCHKPPGCGIGQLPTTDCGAWRVKIETRLCYYCRVCEQAARSFLWSRSRSAMTVAVNLSGVLLLLVTGFHIYLDVMKKSPLNQEAGATTSAPPAA
ncbi:hypothetical protein LINGRAHAP2_LOCUS26750 [Linum grandiflorum]